MKKLLLGLLLFISLFSCNSENKKENKTDQKESMKSSTEIVNEKIKSYIETNANDPKSYEPISTMLTDSITYVQDFDEQIGWGKSIAAMDKYLPDELSKKKHKIQLDSIMKLKEALINSPDSNLIEYLIFTHDCRIKNGFVGLKKTSLRVKVNKNLNIAEVEEIK